MKILTMPDPHALSGMRYFLFRNTVASTQEVLS